MNTCRPENRSRRTFIQFTSAALTSLFLGVEHCYAAVTESVDLEKMIVINALGAISNQNPWAHSLAGNNESLGGMTTRRLRSIDARAIRDAHASGTTAINVTLGYVAGLEDPYEFTINDIAEWNRLIRKHQDHLLKVWSVRDILNAKEQGKIGIIFGFQNAASVGNKVERIKTFANLGVRIIQLTYNDHNQLGDGSMVKDDQGLSSTGYETVASMNENKVLVDLSHSGERTCLDAIRASNSPITISHTGCRALSDLPRNKTDKELRLVADKGGVVGIYFMPFLRQDGQPDINDVVRHIEHALNVCGENHVGIGTDGDTTDIDDMEKYRTAIGMEVRQRQKNGVSAAGESSNVIPLIPDLMGPTQFQKLADLLSLKGHRVNRIEKILGTNFLSLYSDVWL